MVVRIQAYYEYGTGGPANSAWRYWLDYVHDPELTKSPSSLTTMQVQLKLFKLWLHSEYGCRIVETEWSSSLEFKDPKMATLFSMRFT